MQDEVTLFDILFRDIEKRNVRTNWITMVVRIPITIRFTRHPGMIGLERIGHIRIDRYTISLHLPITWHRNHVPSTYIVILTIEVGRT